jgi:hypothetical protein
MASALAAWELDWLWALLLIVMSVVIHVVGLMIIFREAVKIMSITDLRARYGLRRIGFLTHYPMVGRQCSTRSVR